MHRYFMYCRKSSEDEDRQVISNVSQEDELKPLVIRDGLTLAGKFNEEASAKASGTRPLFNEMVSRIKKGEAQAILCWHVNRLSRNAGDAAVLVELMDKRKLLEIRTPSQTFRNTPADKFLIILFCGQAKLENDNKSVDVERGLRKKASMGWYPGVAPTGYLNDMTKLRGERNLYNDPDRFHLVKRMWQMMLTGASTPAHILRIANNQWGFRTRTTRKRSGGPLALSSLYHIFHNPFYYGLFEYPRSSGKWHQGKHEPMITKAEFDRVQALLGRAGNPRPSENLNFSYTGLIRCGACGGMITAEDKWQVRCTTCRFKFSYRERDRCPSCQTLNTKMIKPEFRHYTYYHCAKRSKTNCTQPSIEVAELENQINEQLSRIEISKQFRDWALKYVDELHDSEISAARKTSQSSDKAYADCLRRLEALVKLKTSPENIDGSLLSDEEYSEQRRKLLEEKAALKQSPEDRLRRAELALRQTKATFDFAHLLCSRFAQGDFQVRREILTTIGSNQVLRDKKLIIEAKKPFALLQAFKSPERHQSDPFEPENTAEEQGRNGRTEGDIPTGLSDLEDVRTRTPKKKIVKAVHSYFRKGAVEFFGPYVWN